MYEIDGSQSFGVYYSHLKNSTSHYAHNINTNPLHIYFIAFNGFFPLKYFHWLCLINDII